MVHNTILKTYGFQTFPQYGIPVVLPQGIIKFNQTNLLAAHFAKRNAEFNLEVQHNEF